LNKPGCFRNNQREIRSIERSMTKKLARTK
jgi:hypothetical protein